MSQDHDQTETTQRTRRAMLEAVRTCALPVIADESVAGRRISLGAGAHGVAVTLGGDDVIRVLDATVADISD